MSLSTTSRNLQLEALEPRLLLSADGLCGVMMVGAASANQDDVLASQSVIEVQLQSGSASQDASAAGTNGQETSVNSPNGSANSVFDVDAGVTIIEDDVAGQNDAVSGNTGPNGEIPGEATNAATSAQQILTSTTIQTNLSDPTDLTNSQGNSSTNTANTDGQTTGNSDPTTDQMVETLRAANGPPTSPITTLPGGGRSIELNPDNAQLFGTELVTGPGDILKGAGGELSLINGGVWSPGHSPLITTITGNFTQLAGAETIFEIGGTTVGTEYDQTVVNGVGFGNVNLDGRARITKLNLGNGWVPTVGQSFTIMTWTGTRTGQFNQWLGTVADIGTDLAWVPTYNDIAKTLTLTIQATPGYNPIKTQVENLIHQVGEVGDKIDQVGALAAQLPFIGSSVSAILDQKAAIQTVLEAKLNSLAGTLSVADVTAGIEGFEGQVLAGFTIHVDGVLAKFGALITNPVSWDVDLRFVRADTINFTFGTSAAFSAGLTASGTVNSTLHLDFTFGKDATDYYITVRKQEAIVDLNTTVTGTVGLTLPAGAATLSATGPAVFNGKVVVAPNAGILTGGKIYLSTLTSIGSGGTSAVTNFTLTPTGAMNVDLTLAAATSLALNAGGTMTINAAATAHLTIVGANVFTTAPDVDFKFTNATMSLGANYPGIQGSFNINTDGTTTYIDATITRLRLTVGTNRLMDMTGTASFVLANGEVAGKADLTLALGPVAGIDLTMTGTWHLEVNTSADAVSVPYGVGTVSVPGGQYLRVELENGTVAFTVNPTFTLSGDFVFEQNGSGASAVTAVGASGVSFSFGDDLHPNLIMISNGAGILVLKNGGMAGSLTGTLTETIPGVDLAGTFTVIMNDTGGAVSESVTVGGVTQSVVAPAGINGNESYLKIVGTGTTLTVAGVTLTGNFTYENFNTLATHLGLKVIAVGASNVTGSLTVGATNLVTLSNGSGAFLITNDGLAGTATVTYALNVPQLTVSTAGTATLTINQTGVAVNTTVDVGLMEDAVINVQAGPYVKIETTGAILSLLGADGVTVSGNFAYERYTTADGDVVVKVAASNANLQLGALGNSNLIQVSNASGYFLFNSNGMAGTASGTVSVGGPLVGVVSLTGAFKILINTTPYDVDEDFVLASGTVAVEAPAGPYVKISGTGVAMTVTVAAVGNVVLNGNFVFEQKRDSVTHALSYTQVGGSNISASLSTAGFTVNIINGIGGFRITTAGIAGQASVPNRASIGDPYNITFTSVTGVSFVAENVLFKINNTNADVPSTTVAVSDTENITFSYTGAYYKNYVGITGAVTVTLTVPVNFTLKGDFSFELINLGASNLIRLAATNVSADIKIGSNPALMSFNNGSGAFVISSAGIAGTATLDFQTGFVTVSGTIKLEINNTGAAALYNWLDPAGNAFSINLPLSPHLLICVNGHVVVGSFDIPVNFQIRQTAGGLYFETKPGGVEIFHLDPDGTFHAGTYITFPATIDFANPSPEDILTFLQTLANWFTLFGGSSLFDTMIPFTDKTLGDAVDFAKGFIETFYNKLVSAEVSGTLTALPVSGTLTGSVSITIGSTTYLVNLAAGGAFTSTAQLLTKLNNRINAVAGLAGNIEARINRNGVIAFALTETAMKAGTLQFSFSGATGMMATLGFGVTGGSATISRYTLEQFPLALSRIIGIAGNAASMAQWTWATALPAAPATLLPFAPITYDPHRKVYVFPVNFTYTPTLPDVDFKWGTDIGPLGSATLSGKIRFEPSLHFGFDLGLDLNAKEVPRIISSQALPTPTNGRVSADLSFRLYVNGSAAPITITVLKTATDNNFTADDLVADLNAALTAAADFTMPGGAIVDLAQILVIQKAGPVIALSVLQENDLDGDGHIDVQEDVNANGVLDVGEDMDADGNLDIKEDLNSDGDMADDFLGVLNQIKITVGINNPFATELGFGDEVKNPDAGIGYPLGYFQSVVNSSMKGIFLDNIDLSATLKITTPVLITGSLNFGFLKITVSGGQVTTTDPYTHVAKDINLGFGVSDPTTGSERFYLSEMMDVLNNIGTYIDGPDLTGALYLGFTNVSATIGSHTLFNTGEISIWIPKITVLTYNSSVYNIGDALTTNDEGTFLTYPNFGLGGGTSFQKISFTDVLHGLEAAVDTISDFSAFSFLNEKIPLINISVHDLVDYAGQFADLVDAISGAGSSNIQDMLATLKANVVTLFHIDPNSFDINLDTNGIVYGSGVTVSTTFLDKSRFTFNPNGGSNGFTITSFGAGSSAAMNGSQLVIMGDPSVTGNNATATWDAITKILTILIDVNNTEAGTVVSVINSSVAAYWSAALIAADTSSSIGVGKGKIHTNALKFSFHYTAAYANQLPLQLDLADLVDAMGNDNPTIKEFLKAATTLIHVGGSGMLNISASAAVTLDFGLDLTNPCAPSLFLYDTTGVSLTAKVTATNLNFDASIGALGIFIRNGSVTFDYDGKGGSTNPAIIALTLNDTDGDGRHSIDGSLLSFDNIGLVAHAGITAVLPLYAPTTAIAVGSTSDLNLDGYPDNAIVLDVPDLVRLLVNDTTSLNMITNKQEARLSFRGSGNDVIVTKIATGGSELEVIFHHNAAIGVGAPTVVLTGNTLDITINSGVTTVAQLTTPGTPWASVTFTLAGGDAVGYAADNGKLRKFTLYAPNLNGLFDNLDLCALIDSATGPFLTSLDGALLHIQEGLTAAVGNSNLPLIGNGMAGVATFIQNFREGLLAELRARIEASGSALGAIQDAIKEAIWNSLGPNGLNILVNAATGAALDPAQGYSQLDVVLTCDGLAVNIRLKKELALLDTTQNPIDFDLGVDGFGLSVEGNVKLSLGFDLKLGFGFNKSDGFYIVTSDGSGDPELVLGFEATIPGLAAKGTLFFLQLDVNDDPDAPSSFVGRFMVDLRDPNSDGKLTWAEITSSGTELGDMVHADLEAIADVNLELEASFGGNANFPHILADFHLGWSWSLSGGSTTPDIAFNNVRLDLGTFISDVIGPILAKVQEITGPIQPIIDIAVARLPIISDLAGKDITFLDLAEAFGYLDPGTRKFIEQVIKVIDLINSIPTGGGSVIIPIGSFHLGQASDGKYTSVNPLGSLSVEDLATRIQNDLDAASSASLTQQSQTAGFVGDQGLGSMDNFKIPFLQNPSELFGLFTGQAVRLIEWQMPTFKFEFTYTQKIPIYPPLYAQFGGTIGAEFQIGFGYDTSGIQKFIEGGAKDVAQIFDGFYIADYDANGHERAEVTLKGEIFAGVSINLGLVEVGVNGGISAVITFDLNDITKDGRVHVSELIANAQQDIRCIFDIHGELRLFLEAFLKVNLFFFKIDKTWRFGDFLLFSFDITCPVPTLATIDGAGKLTLNMGTNAGGRMEIDTADGAETFTVSHVSGTAGNEKVSVTWRSYSAEFDGVTSIFANAGAGSDYLDVTGTLVPVDIDMGAGDDILILGWGAGSTARGGAGNDTITVPTDDQSVVRNTSNKVYGDDGNDTLVGPGNVSITIYGGGGTDIITGSSQADVLDGGDGADTITGNAGDDTITGGAGNDKIYGNDGHDIIDAGAGADFVEGASGNDSITAGSGDDEVFGDDGNDKIAGGTGNDKLYGNGGADLIVGDEFNLTLFTYDLSTANTAGGTFTITGITGTGNDFIVGGGSFDVLFGGDGDDFVFGGNYFSGGATQMVEDDDNDFMDGGRGNDQMFGDDANGKEGDRDTGISITSNVWHDLDLDGVRDSTEAGIPNVTVKLYKASDNSLFTSTTTDSSGKFELLGLDPLDYYITFTIPTGYTPTLQNVGDALPFSDLDSAGELTTDSDIDATGKTSVFQMDYNEAAINIAAGFTGVPQLTITTQAVNEGGSGRQTAVTFIYTLSGPSLTAITLNYSTLDGTAASVGKDYTKVNSTALTFAPGETSKTVTINVTGDEMFELDEDFKLVTVPVTPAQLFGAPASMVTQAIIVNDDARPVFTITDASLTEPGVNQIVKISIKLVNPSYQTVTVGYQTTDEIDPVTGVRVARSATAGIDYNVLSGTATFLPGDVQKDIYVTVLGDAIDEYDETLFVTLFNPTNATVSDSMGSIVILDNDVAPTITLTPFNPDGGVAPLNFRTTVFETDFTAQAVQFTVTLAGLTEKTITVRYDTARGTAISDSYDELTEPIDFTNNASSLDYSSSSDSDTTLTFSPGGPLSQTLTVWVQPDNKTEGDEFFYFNLLNTENATIANNHVIVKIIDDDSGPSGVGSPFDVRFSRPDYHAAEGDVASTGYVTLVRSLTSTKAYTVLSMDGGTATFTTDYTTSGSNRQLVTFEVGEAVKLVPIYIVGDNIHEADETILFSLRKPTGEPVRGSPGSAVFTIEDDDDVAVLVKATATSVTEGGAYQFEIHLVDYNDPTHPDIATERPITVSYVTSNLTAVSGGDYVAIAGSHLFPAGSFAPWLVGAATINPGVADPEATEMFRLRISPVTTGVYTAQAFADVSIIDNDTTTIKGFVFHDNNDNGYWDQDGSEPAFVGAKVALTDSSGTTYNLTTIGDGSYSQLVLYGDVHVAMDGTGVGNVLEGYEVTTENDNQDVTFTAGSAPLENIGYKLGFTLTLPKGAETTGRGGTDDTIFGGPGDDYIDAGAGDDHVVGGHWQTATSANSPINQGTYDAVIIANFGGSITNPQTAPIWTISTAGLGGGSISGQIWVDTNNSNVQDEGLYNTGEVMVTLLDGEGNVVNVVATTTGSYTFTGLYKGTYIVQWDLPNGQQFVTPGIGGVAVNSDAVVAGRTAKLTLATDTSVLNNIDAGLEASGTLPVASGSTIQFSQASYHAVESATVGTHTFITITLLRSNAAAVENVAWFMHDGTALAGTNYVKTQGTVNFAIGETLKSFEIELISTGQNICDAKDFTLSTRKPTGQPIAGGETTIYVHGAAAGSDTDDDTILAGDDWDVVLGDSGYIDANALPNTASTKIHDTGGLGHDDIHGNDGPDYINGQLGNDILAGDEGDDIVLGGYGDDRIEVTLDDDLIFGGNGRDVVFGEYDGQVIQIDAAKIWFSLDTTVNSGDSEFTLNGVESLELYGGAGDNTFIVNGWAGEAFLFGGDGTDALKVTNDMDMKLADASALQKLLYALLGGMNVEANLTLLTTGTAYHVGEIESVALAGGAGANSIDASGYSKDVTLEGAGGNDTLLGGTGKNTFVFDVDNVLGTDTITGNTNTDTLDFSNSATGVSVNLSTVGVSQTVRLGFLDVVLTATDIENVIGGSAADTITGNSLNNTITGGAGGDTMAGGTGNDTYVFDADSALGADIITELLADAGEDTLDFSGSSLLQIFLDMALTSVQVININLSITLTGGGFENAAGGVLNDDLRGNALNNKLYGNAGNDSIFGATGDDYLDGGLGTDTLDGGDGIDSISATADSNFQLTNSQLTRNGSDVDYLNLIEGATLTGGVSNNVFTLTGWTGFATIAGSGGTDTLIYNADVNMTLTGAAGTDLLSLNGGAHTFSLTGVETYLLTGGVSNNTLNASGYNSGGSVTLDGAAGNDTLVGSKGTDTLRGGSGNDGITGGEGFDNIDGGTGTDTLLEISVRSMNLSNTTLAIVYFTLSYTDSLISIETLNIVGTAGNNTFTVTGSPVATVTLNGAGGTGDALIVSTSYNATLTNTSLALSNLPGVSFTLAGFEIGQLTGSAGANVLNAAGFSGSVTLNGGSGDDILTGGSGNDTLNGGDGNDTYKFNTSTALGTDTITDASGTDTLDFSGSSNAVVVNLTLLSNVTTNVTINWAAAVSLENVIGGNAGDTLTGTAGDNQLTGGAGIDNLNGGGGNDTYLFNTNTALGTDNISDSSGVDTLDFTGSTGVITINLVNATNIVNANLTINYTGTFENVIGGSGNDNLTGNGSDNRLTGGAGTDTLDGAAGNDTYIFDTDTALGTDTIVDVSGTDTLDFSASALAVTVDLNTAAVLGIVTNVVNANLALRWATGVLMENLTGGSGNDALSGNSSVNILTGGAGNDALNGGNGNDTYVFNTDTALGSDTISDNTGTDTLDFSASTTSVSVNLETAAVAGTVTNVVNTRLTLQWASTVTLENLKGGSANDTLIGNASNNTIEGGAGDDEIDGRAGVNTLVGGAGDDHYFFDLALAGRDMNADGLCNATDELTVGNICRVCDNTITELVGGGDDTIDGAGGGLVMLTWTTFNIPDPEYPLFRIKFTTASTVEHSL